LTDSFADDKGKSADRDLNKNSYSYSDYNNNSSYLSADSSGQKYAYKIADDSKSTSGLNPLPPLGIVSHNKRTFESNNSFGNDLDIPLRRNWADKTPPSRPYTDFGHYRSNPRLNSLDRPVAFSTSAEPLANKSALNSSYKANKSDFSSGDLQSAAVASSPVTTKWPEFSPLSSPSELLSAATLKRATRNASTNYSAY
jgi:hypothetical protein